jgi:hypothetical protein
VVSSTLNKLVAVAFILQVAAWSLFFRMAIEVNRVLPKEKRIPLFEFRYHISEIKHLHEQRFPSSKLRVGWMTLAGVSALIVSVAVILGIRPTRANP